MSMLPRLYGNEHRVYSIANLIFFRISERNFPYIRGNRLIFDILFEMLTTIIYINITYEFRNCGSSYLKSCEKFLKYLYPFPR